MIRRRTITSYVWNSVSGNKMVILSNCIRNFFRKFELLGNSVQGENPAPDNPQEIKSAGRFDEASGKYLLDVKVTGKNLFNKELIKKAMQGVSYLYVPIYVKKGSKVSFSYSKTLPSGLNFYVLLARDMGASYGYYSWLYHSTATSLCNNEGTFVADNDVISLSFFGSDLDIMIENLFNYLQIEISDKPTPYEPYTEQTVQIALDEPLRGIGDYKDVLTKDGVVRKIAPYEVNLNDLRDGGYSKTNTVMFSVKVQNKTVGYASSKPSILCNILPDCALQMSNIYNNDKECIAVGGGIVLFRVNKSRLKDMSSFEATKQSFIELMADKKMIVEYALETPVTEPLPESVQQQLQALHSENGTTHVFVDSGEVECGINIEYKYKS